MKLKISIQILVIHSILLSSVLFAQSNIQSNVIANGGTTAANATNRISGTIGQPILGKMTGPSNSVQAGFWEQVRGIITGVNFDNNALPSEFLLFQNYPNPFNPSTKIQFQVSSNSQVTLKVYDILGNEIAALINAEKPAGKYEIQFDASALSSGVYFYKIQAGSFVNTKKMILLR